jgi:hypothetical protein
MPEPRKRRLIREIERVYEEVLPPQAPPRQADPGLGDAQDADIELGDDQEGDALPPPAPRRRR